MSIDDWILQAMVVYIMNKIKRDQYPTIMEVSQEVAVMMNATRKTNYATKLVQRLNVIKVAKSL